MKVVRCMDKKMIDEILREIGLEPVERCDPKETKK